MKQFARAVLHFGADKTGSTSIQAFLDATREPLLRQRSIAYAPRARHARLGSWLSPAPERFLFNFENGARDDQAIRADDETYLAELQRWLAAVGSAETLVFSDESFLDLDPVALRRLHAFTARLAAEVEVLLYVRPPLSYARSAISQRVRMGRPPWSPSDLPIRRYRDRLPPILDAFGRNAVYVKPFEREILVHGDATTDFCGFLGLPPAAVASLAGPTRIHLNEGLSEQAVAFGEALRRRLEAAGYRFPPNYFAGRFGAVLADIGGPPLLLDSRQADVLLDEWAPHAQYLQAEFGLELVEDFTRHVRHGPPPERDLALAASLGNSLAEEILRTQRVDCATGMIECTDVPRQVAPGEIFTLQAMLRNASPRDWLAIGPHPVRVSYHWLGADRGMHHWEGLRSELPTIHLPPGASVVMSVRVQAPTERGSYVLQLSTLQEGCAWLDEKGFTVAEHPVIVH